MGWLAASAASESSQLGVDCWGCGQQCYSSYVCSNRLTTFLRRTSFLLCCSHASPVDPWAPSLLHQYRSIAMMVTLTYCLPLLECGDGNLALLLLTSCSGTTGWCYSLSVWHPCHLQRHVWRHIYAPCSMSVLCLCASTCPYNHITGEYVYCWLAVLSDQSVLMDGRWGIWHGRLIILTCITQ